MNNNSSNGPTIPKKRIISLDALRGLAIMGILIANVQLFAMIKIAEFNPMAYGDMTGINYLVALVAHVIVGRKFMTIFTMLFGAGVLMMADNMEARGKNPAKRHYPRMFWLFVIGSINYYFISPGEILSFYAVTGLVLFFFRKLSAKKLLIYGLICICVPAIIDITFQFRARSPQGLAAQEQMWQPGPKVIQEELDRNQGKWVEQVKKKIKSRRWLVSLYFYYQSIFSYLGRMLIGMALFRWGILTAKARKRTYWKILLYAGGFGMIICILGWLYNSSVNWSYKYSLMLGSQFNELGSVILAPGYMAGFMLIIKSGRFQNLIKRLAAVGRMALTNFIMHSFMNLFIFFGVGLGLGGKLQRWEQMLVVFAIWAFQLFYSTWWLKRFHFGPVEWLWRSLTYWKRQPMKLKKETG